MILPDFSPRLAEGESWSEGVPYFLILRNKFQIHKNQIPNKFKYLVISSIRLR
jgi:hypothetical protein